MSKREILELLRLNGWTKTDLASRLGLSESAIHRWLERGRVITGPAAILMRQWLEEARAARERCGA